MSGNHHFGMYGSKSSLIFLKKVKIPIPSPLYSFLMYDVIGLFNYNVVTCK